MARKFLAAEWRKLIFANYEIDAVALQNYVPVGTELDDWNGVSYVSLVGFMFMNTRIHGVRIPFHSNFPEVNLRFYVRYKETNVWKRGVVFVREIVSKPALSFVANTLFNERYTTLPMKHEWRFSDGELQVNYQWRVEKKWNMLAVTAPLEASALLTGTKEEYITEHFWGYSAMNKLRTAEYQVEHPSWHIYPVNEYRIDCDFGRLYGKEFTGLNERKPASVFLAEGSEVNVFYKRVL